MIHRFAIRLPQKLRLGASQFTGRGVTFQYERCISVQALHSCPYQYHAVFKFLHDGPVIVWVLSVWNSFLGLVDSIKVSVFALAC
jgi:hypothetical protein